MMSKREWDEKYYKPVVEEKIVGFSGLDPQRKLSDEEEEAIGQMVNDDVEAKMNTVLEIRVG